MLSVTSQTAMKAVIFLGSKSKPGQRFSIQSIAENLGASQHTVGKLLQTLVKEDIIKSLKGPSGGFYITEEQMDIPLIEIIYAIDGKEVFKTCGLGLKKCSSLHPCPIHDEYKNSRDAMEKLFASKKISDLCVNVQSGLVYLSI